MKNTPPNCAAWSSMIPRKIKRSNSLQINLLGQQTPLVSYTKRVGRSKFSLKRSNSYWKSNLFWEERLMPYSYRFGQQWLRCWFWSTWKPVQPSRGVCPTWWRFCGWIYLWNLTWTSYWMTHLRLQILLRETSTCRSTCLNGRLKLRKRNNLS